MRKEDEIVKVLNKLVSDKTLSEMTECERAAFLADLDEVSSCLEEYFKDFDQELQGLLRKFVKENILCHLPELAEKLTSAEFDEVLNKLLLLVASLGERRVQIVGKDRFEYQCIKHISGDEYLFRYVPYGTAANVQELNKADASKLGIPYIVSRRVAHIAPEDSSLKVGECYEVEFQITADGKKKLIP